jgi:hypothetical protein
MGRILRMYYTLSSSSSNRRSVYHANILLQLLDSSLICGQVGQHV